ncbi:MAG TPA: hypothetical protein VE990_04755 [Acidimicrobiales bacterium]|nr:hypothetical protein [Acidimicrobiales bacterium]
MRRPRPALAMWALVLAGCTGAQASAGTAPTTPLGRLVDSLAPLHDGVMHLSLLSYPGTQMSSTAGAVGYTVDGPFSEAHAGDRLPLARLVVQREPTGASVTLVSDGRSASMTADGRTVQLSRAQQAELTQDMAGGDLTGLKALGVTDWARGPERADTTTSAGTEVDRVETAVDPVAAVNGLEKVVADTGGGSTATISGTAAAALRREDLGSQLVVEAGHGDHTLRMLDLWLRFGAGAGDQLSAALGQLAGLRIHLQMSVASPNSATMAG